MMINSKELISQLKGCIKLSNVLLDELLDDKNAAYIKGKIFAYENVIDFITNMSESEPVITNGDWVRSMDDDELLEFLDNVEECDVDWRGDDSCENCMNIGTCTDCKQCIKDWIAREYTVKTVRRKTYKEDFLEKYPDAVMREIIDVPLGCVRWVYGENHIKCVENCMVCWNKPINEVK